MTVAEEDEDDYELGEFYFFFLKISKCANFSIAMSLFNARMRTSYSHVHIPTNIPLPLDIYTWDCNLRFFFYIHASMSCLVWALTKFCGLLVWYKWGNEHGEPSHHLLIHSPPMVALLPMHPKMSQFVHYVVSSLYFHLLQQLGRVEHELEGPYEGE